MLNRLLHIFWSLKSKRAKRREMEQAFASVDEPPEPSVGAKVRVFIYENWKFLITSLIAVAGLALTAARFMF